MPVELTEKLLSQAAGWDVMKMARVVLDQGKVLSSFYEPPLLRGVVQSSGTSYRASLVIRSAVDMENLCTCRDAREWGKICTHVVAVGLHWIKNRQLETSAAKKPANPAAISTASPARKPSSLKRDASGEPAELFIILPPNFDQAAQRGKVMLVLEAKWSGGRCPLNALPKGRTFAFSAQDNAVIEGLENLTQGETPAMLQIDTKDFSSLLPALIEHPNITLGKTAGITVTKTPWKPPLRATLETNGEIVLTLKSNSDAPVMIANWIWSNRTLQPIGLPNLPGNVFHEPVRITRAQVPAFLSQHWPALLASGVEANFKLEDFTLEPQAPKFLLELKGGLAQLSALLQCAYGPRIMTVGVTTPDEGVWLPDPDSPTRYSTRDFNAERNALGRLQRNGFNGPDSQGRLQLLGQGPVLNFFAREFPKLQREWTVTLEDRLDRSAKQNIERIEPRFQITPWGVQWFDLGVVFTSTGGETFSQTDIQRLLLSGQSHTRLKNGRMAVIDTGAVEELQEVLLDCAPQQHGNGYRINNQQAGFLESTLQQNSRWSVQAPAAWRERAAKQSGEAKLECPPLGELENVLRPYQKQGVAWLRFLRENNFGGILADEMGLGKTLQTLAHLSSCSSRHKETQTEASLRQSLLTSKPHLIVCPTSLVFNWLAEARKFTPQLRVLALHGPDRHARFSEIPQHDLVVTSYALIRRDAERYRDVEFDTVVLDEAQHIKNRQTQNAQAVKAIKSDHRLVLTGTPLENSVLDLWSIFDFLMPGYLGTAQDFRERYEQPITRDKSAEAQSRLARRLKPFLLRRLKEDVAADLPEKLEQVSFCELTPDQRGVYQQLIEATRKEVLEAVGEQGEARSRMMVLSALLRLRQVCCDLRLLKLDRMGDKSEDVAKPASGSPDSRLAALDSENARAATLQFPLSHPMGEGPVHGEGPQLFPEKVPSPQPSPRLGGAREKTAAPPAFSGKLDLFSELLEEVIDGGHRVLVFSQFVSMLALLKERLNAESIEYCYLDGSTTNRAEVVERFQSDAKIPVFLISLKAGGVGLNLTGADTVIHFDPWWNPAVENQATDRAHRIGQTRVVTSYKLITRDTIEEKILTLQNRKREIIQATIGDEETFAASLNWEEIKELLS